MCIWFQVLRKPSSKNLVIPLPNATKSSRKNLHCFELDIVSRHLIWILIVNIMCPCLRCTNIIEQQQLVMQIFHVCRQTWLPLFVKLLWHHDQCTHVLLDTMGKPCRLSHQLGRLLIRINFSLFHTYDSSARSYMCILLFVSSWNPLDYQRGNAFTTHVGFCIFKERPEPTWIDLI
jgi:hypothetical protein